jgi:hypothetical protein
VLPDCRPGACTPANYQRQPVLLLARWQRAAPVVPSLAALIALPARHARGARCGVRQHGCRSSQDHDPARGTPLTLLVKRMLWVLVRAPRLSPRRMHTCQLPTIAYPASGSLAENSSSRAITRRIDYLARSSCAWCAVWSAAAMLPQQSGSRPGAWHVAKPAGHGSAGCARYNHRFGQE